MKNPNRRQKYRLKTIAKVEELNASFERVTKQLEESVKKLTEQFEREDREVAATAAQETAKINQ